MLVVNSASDNFTKLSPLCDVRFLVTLEKKIDDIFRKPIAWRNEMKKLDFTHIHFGWQTSYVLDDLHKLKPFTTNTAVF